MEHGAYYRSDSGWLPLSRTVMLPLLDGGAAQYLNVGPRGAVADLPGPQAIVRSSTTRPTIYLRGFSPASGVYLVREKRKTDHRETHMRVSRHLQDGPRFHKGDLFELDVQAAGPGVIALRPRTALPAGEYVIVAPPEPQYRWINFGFSFGIPTGATGS